MIDENSTADQAHINRTAILSWFNGASAKKTAKISAIAEYIGNNHFRYDHYKLTHRKVLKNYISFTLYQIIFGDKDFKGEPEEVEEKMENYCRIVSAVRTIAGSQLSIPVVSVEENEPVFSNAFSPRTLAYNLWKRLLSFDGLTGVEQNTIPQFVVTEDKEEHLSDELQQLCDDLPAVEETETEKLVEYAQKYAKCRGMIDNLKNNSAARASDSRCSYENPELYKQLEEPYNTLYEQSFYMGSDQNALHTAAGLPDGQYDHWLDLRIGESVEKRTLLNVVLQFYQAFKAERNATNHAEEIGNLHMNYRCTVKAIEVFTELCKRLAELSSQV